jgi:hypothetical protein
MKKSLTAAMQIQPTKFFFLVTAVALASTLVNPNSANSAPILYTISSSATNPAAGPGQLNPGTLTGTFDFDPTTGTYSSVSLDIEGVQSTNLNGTYVLDTSATQTSTDLRIQGNTLINSGGQSNLNSFLNVTFNTSLGTTPDQIVHMFAFQGNPANFTTPPTVAFADPSLAPAVPEPASLALLGSALLGFGIMLRRCNRV